MKKNALKIATVLAGTLMLTACTISVDPPKIDTVYPIDYTEKPTTDVNLPDPGTVEPDSVDTPKPATDPEPDKTPIDVPVTIYVTKELISNPEEAKVSAVFTGIGENSEEIWTYQTEEVYVGQYEDITRCVVNDNGAYFVCGHTLYCIDTTTENYGNVKWKNEENYGGGSSIVFDENGYIYVMGYEKNGFVVVDVDGNTVNKVEELKFADDEDRYEWFWKNMYDCRSGLIEVYFDSVGDIKLFDVVTGEEYVPEVDPSWLAKEWRMTSWEIEDSEYLAEESEENYEIEIDENLNVSFIFTSWDDKKEKFKDMPATLRVGDMYYTIDDSYYGRWYLECEYDDENYFTISLTEPDCMEVFWYNGPWTDEVYPAVVWMKFKDADAVQ